jgi:hypothetical protein
MSDIIRLELDGRALTQDELFRIAHLLFVGGGRHRGRGAVVLVLAPRPEPRRLAFDV